MEAQHDQRRILKFKGGSMNEEPKCYVKVDVKKSSSKTGGVGYDVSVLAGEGASEDRLNALADLALRTALKSYKVCRDTLEE